MLRHQRRKASCLMLYMMGGRWRFDCAWIQNRRLRWRELPRDYCGFYLSGQQHHVTADWVTLYRAVKLSDPEWLRRPLLFSSNSTGTRMMQLSCCEEGCCCLLAPLWEWSPSIFSSWQNMHCRLPCLWFPPTMLKLGTSEKPNPSGFCPAFVYSCFDNVNILNMLNVFHGLSLARMCH